MTVADRPPGYRTVLRVGEFRALFLADTASVVGDQVARIAVAVLVFERTRSPLAASATFACSYLSWLLAGPLLSAVADRVPRRRVMVAGDVARAALVLFLVVPGVPLAVVFGALLLVGLLGPPFEAARSALLADVLDGDRYVVGNALLGTVFQVGQIAGFLVGGALVQALGTRPALVVDAATFLVSGLLVLARVRERPVIRDDDAGNALSAGARLVLGSPELRSLLGWGLAVALVTVPPDGLAVAVAAESGNGALLTGVLIATLPVGFMLGSLLVLRLPVERRRALFPALVLVSSASLALSPLLDDVRLLAVAWTVAGVGMTLQTVANSAFVQAVPPALRGRAFGVAASALMAVQGVALLVTGALAGVLGARGAVAVPAVAVGGGLLVLLATRLVSGAQPAALPSREPT